MSCTRSGPRIRNQPAARVGATTVDFALIASVLFLVIFSAVEVSRACMLQNTVKIAAAQDARVGIVPDATAEECRQRSLEERVILGVRGASVSVVPATLDAGADVVTLSVRVPFDTNGYRFARFFVGKMR